MAASFLYYLLIIDLVVFSNRVSAFFFVYGRMFGKMGMLLFALGAATATRSAISGCGMCSCRSTYSCSTG